jgi:tetratricopeptide (TPR) repeat protein
MPTSQSSATEAALKRYEALQAESPGDVDILETLASLYESTGRPKEAASCLRELAALVDDPAKRALIYRKLAAAFRRMGATAEAEECLEWVLALDKACEPVYEELVALYLSERRWRAAIDVYLRHARVALRATRARIHANVARLYEEELHDLQRAVDCYQLLEQDLDDPTPALRAVARLAEQREEFDQAVRALTRLAEQSPPAERIELLVHAGNLTLDRLSDSHGAEELFRRALALDPTSLPARLGAAAALREREDADTAVALLREGAEQALTRADTVGLLTAAAELESDLGDGSVAADLWRDVWALDPELERAGEAAAELLERTERWDDLLDVRARLASLPGEPDVRFERYRRLGEAELVAGKPQRAKRAFDSALKIRPGEPTAERGWAEALLALEHWDEAAHALTRALETPGAKYTGEERARLHTLAGVAFRRMGKQEEAIKQLAAALALDPLNEIATREKALLVPDRDSAAN